MAGRIEVRSVRNNKNVFTLQNDWQIIHQKPCESLLTKKKEESTIGKVLRQKCYTDVCLAQLDRAFGYGPKGRGFESSSARFTESRFFLVLFFCNKKELALDQLQSHPVRADF